MKTPSKVLRIPQLMMIVPLAPVLVVQGRRVARTMPRLAPATGADRGVAGDAAPGFRLTVLGDSTAVGVGAATHAQALPGFLAEALRGHLGLSVAWSVTGRSGASARKAVTDLVPRLNGCAPDLLVVTVGVNDLIQRRPLRAWAADTTELVTTLRDRHGRATVLVAGMPPVHRFPALPQPLRAVVGARARDMDRIVRDVAHENGAIHVPMDEDMARDRRLFASDGFHPSEAGYRAWADDLALAAAPQAAPDAPAGQAAEPAR